MKLLFDIDKEGNVMDQDNTIALVPELLAVYKEKNYGSDAIRWIIMMYDYKSPYRQLPYEDRIKTVTQNIYGKLKHYIIDKPLMKDAIDAYKKLQYDPLIDQYNLYTEKITEYTEALRAMDSNEKNLEKQGKIMKTMADFTLAREKVRELILKNENSSAKMHGTDSSQLSFLEERQRLE